MKTYALFNTLPKGRVAIYPDQVASVYEEQDQSGNVTTAIVLANAIGYKVELTLEEVTGKLTAAYP